MKKKIIIIGAGFGGLSAAALLAKEGHEITVLEKNIFERAPSDWLNTNVSYTIVGGEVVFKTSD